MDVVDNGQQSFGELLGVNLQHIRAVAPPEVSVVDVDVLVSGSSQSRRNHVVGLFDDTLCIDAQRECVPRAPAHRRRQRFLLVSRKRASYECADDENT